MILLLGDLHGEWGIINSILNGPYRLLEDRIGPEAAAENFVILQVGDFGFYDRRLLEWPDLPFKTYAIDGNHEDFRLLRNKKSVTEMRKNLFYVPRGTILDLFGYRVGCCGGGFSIDKAWRKSEVSWFADEEVLEEHIAPLINVPLDFIVTHTPPQSIIDRNFPKLDHEYWHLPKHWIDTSATAVEKLYQSTNVPIYCGHMHRSVKDDRVQILDINEMVPIADKE